jgi:hypothetical protein
MDGDAFLFMILSWALILGLNIFCFTLLFTRNQPQTEEVSQKDSRKSFMGDEEEIT